MRESLSPHLPEKMEEDGIAECGRRAIAIIGFGIKYMRSGSKCDLQHEPSCFQTLRKWRRREVFTKNSNMHPSCHRTSFWAHLHKCGGRRVRWSMTKVTGTGHIFDCGAMAISGGAGR